MARVDRLLGRRRASLFLWWMDEIVGVGGRFEDTTNRRGLTVQTSVRVGGPALMDPEATLPLDAVASSEAITAKPVWGAGSGWASWRPLVERTPRYMAPEQRAGLPRRRTAGS
jgi:hypothetical protein